ncbi:hypothetical protein [Rhizobium sp. BK491]|uniref:hypothetical protein n=1 Tax=Rhizobium sp. BK491 TaxID=2587009 RepID=UPI0016123B80|nr:hypothetical protein [Rhizobium sp. BK491]MBB3567204.1 hypothetical protein [Rhizobium sp. BK491]
MGIGNLDEGGCDLLLIPSSFNGRLRKIAEGDVNGVLAFQVPVRISRRQGWWRYKNHLHRMDVISGKSRSFARLCNPRRFTPLLIPNGFFSRERLSFTAKRLNRRH